MFKRNWIICIISLNITIKLFKKDLDQLIPNHIKLNSNHGPSDIVSEIPYEESLIKETY